MTNKDTTPDISLEDFEQNYLRSNNSSICDKTLKGTLFLSQILNHQNLIMDMLKKNYKLTSVYGYMQDKGLITMPYVTFNQIIHRSLLGQTSSIKAWRLDGEIRRIDAGLPAVRTPVGSAAKQAGPQDGKRTKTRTSAPAETRSKSADDGVASAPQDVKKKLELPSLANWDGDSTKWIDNLIGD